MSQSTISSTVSPPKTGESGGGRRHDLDALRAAAMLLGIAYHAALSFSLGAGWMVQDIKQSKLLYLFQAFVHGFRMQLFMVLSGFFTAMLWRKRGLRVLLWNRFQRVLVPCLVGLITVVPATKWAGAFAARFKASESRAATVHRSAWGSIQMGDFPALWEHSKRSELLPEPQPDLRLTALSWAALAGSGELGGALGGALGEKGADIQARSLRGEGLSALNDHSGEEDAARPFGIGVQSGRVLEARRQILEGQKPLGAEDEGAGGNPRKSTSDRWAGWVHTPVFILVWFLWFLVWLIPVFLIYAVAAERFGWKARPHPLLVTQRSLAWLVPLSMVPIWFMGVGRGEFGPDTSMGIIPMPHVLAYYALFFGFGVLYFECGDSAGRLGRHWRWTMPMSLLVVFPAALEFSAGTFGVRDRLIPEVWHRPAGVFGQALYAWMMSFASVGLFRALLSRESRWIRYLSDASYWFYLAHLPLVIIAQAVVCNWPMPAMLKFLMACVFVGAALLLSYEKLVRHTVVRNLSRPHGNASRASLQNGQTCGR